MTSRYIEELLFQSERRLGGEVELRVSVGRVEVRLRDPLTTEHSTNPPLVPATQYVVQTMEDQEHAATRMDMFDGHYPFAGLSDEDRVELKVTETY